MQASANWESSSSRTVKGQAERAKTPKWLKTDFERWDDEIAIEDTSETSSRASDLRSALREVENGERKEREARQRQLEESIKRGEKAPPRQEITEGIDLDGID